MDYHGIESAVSHLDFDEVTIESLGAHALFGEVDEDSVRDACTFLIKANQLFEKKELTLFVNTPGGNVYDGFALIDLMGVSRLPIKTICLGNVMSMGVLIAAAGTKGKRLMTRNTTVMAHQFTSGGPGKFHELMENYKADVYLKNQFVQHFLRYTTMTEKQINDVLFGASDRYLTPAECRKFGIIDQVIDELPRFNLDLPPLQQSPQPRASGSKRQARQ